MPAFFICERISSGIAELDFTETSFPSTSVCVCVRVRVRVCICLSRHEAVILTKHCTITHASILLSCVSLYLQHREGPGVSKNNKAIDCSHHCDKFVQNSSKLDNRKALYGKSIG